MQKPDKKSSSGRELPQLPLILTDELSLDRLGERDSQKKTGTAEETANCLAGIDLLQDKSFGNNAEFSNFLANKINLSENEARALIFQSGLFYKSRLSRCIWQKPRLFDVRFSKCDLANTQWHDATLNRAEFVECKMTGFKAIDTDAANWRWKNCMGEMVELQGSKLKKSLFFKCSLNNADFRFADLSGATFRNCELRGATFYEANLNGADFRGTSLNGLKARPEDLRGAIISAEQAYELGQELALLMGLKIEAL